MKRYTYLFASLYILLLLLPVPLLFGHKEDKDPPSSQSTDSSGDIVITDVFRLRDTETNKVYSVSERDFVIGAVAAEMYPTYHTEALKAQAVGIYTYYGIQRSKQRSTAGADKDDADFSDEQSGHPVYYSTADLKKRWGNNYKTYYNRIAEAVDAVLGEKILYNGEPILAVYHAISAGTTEDVSIVWGGSSYPYLQPVPSPGDKLSPAYESTVTVTPTELKKALSTKLGDAALPEDASTWLTGNVQTSASGTVIELSIGTVKVTGRELRDALKLRSANFSVEYTSDGFTFTVYGYGHNVGMSQYGADYLARQGATYKEILTHYYTGVTVE